MSKTGETSISKSMTKVIKFINQYPHDWIQQAFSDDAHLAQHLESKWKGYASTESSYESIVGLMTQLSEGNQNKLMEYINRTFAKGGKAGEKYCIRYWETRKDYARPDQYKEWEHETFTNRVKAIDFAEGLFHNKAYYGVEVVDEKGESVFHLSEEMAKGGSMEKGGKAGKGVEKDSAGLSVRGFIRRPNFGAGGVIDKIFSSSPDGISWLITG